MAVVISVVSATADTGKTTVICEIIAELKRRSLRVATIKHTTGSFEIDRAGTDTDRFTRAGADTVVISAPGHLVRIDHQQPEPSVHEIISGIGETDVILVEGYKRESLPKVIVYRAGVGVAFPLHLSPVLAVVSDDEVPVGLRQFRFDEIRSLTDLVLGTGLGSG